MLTLTRVSTLHEADLLSMKLESRGIQTFIPDQGAISANPLHTGAIGGIRVQVNEADAPRAKELLALQEM